MEGRSVLNVWLKTVGAYNVVWMKCNYIFPVNIYLFLFSRVPTLFYL